MIFYSIIVLVLFSSDHGESAPFYTQNSESKFPLPENSQMDHEKIDLELQLKLSNQPELQGKPEFELRTRATEDENSQLTKKLMKNVSEVRKKINEGDQFEEAEIGFVVIV